MVHYMRSVEKNSRAAIFEAPAGVNNDRLFVIGHEVRESRQIHKNILQSDFVSVTLQAAQGLMLSAVAEVQIIHRFQNRESGVVIALQCLPLEINPNFWAAKIAIKPEIYKINFQQTRISTQIHSFQIRDCEA